MKTSVLPQVLTGDESITSSGLQANLARGLEDSPLGDSFGSLILEATFSAVFLEINPSSFLNNSQEAQWCSPSFKKNPH